MNQTDPTAALRAILTVTVETRPDGGHYFDQADFAAHVAQWVRTALKGKHAIGEVTITELPAAASAVVAPPTDRAELRDRIAEALYPTYGQEDRNRSLAIAAAVLAVLPEVADRAAVLLEAAEKLDGLTQETAGADMTMPEGRWRAGLDAGIRVLRRLAAEAHSAGAQQQEAEEPRCDAGFVFGGRCVKPAGHRDPHVTAPVAQQPAADTRREPDPEAVEREREIQRDAQLPRVKHSGPDTEFCVLCLSGEHERVAAEQQPAAADDEETP